MKILDFLCRELSKSELDVRVFAYNSPRKYRVYSIPKRKAGLRTIAHPAKELKVYQRALSSYLSDILPVHCASYAYKKGSSIKLNAERHKSNKYLLKMDFDNFFNSISSQLFKKIIFSTNTSISAKDLELLISLSFWSPNKKLNDKLILSVGAPISPLISNFIMYEFDTLIHDWCVNNKITYTRYADDISFSTNVRGALFNIPQIVKKSLKESFNSDIIINPSKTVYSSKAHNRHITGITITNAGELSLGRARKRYISSLIHKFKLNILDIENIEHMKGLLAFASHIEPDFIKRMENKYSQDTINQINCFKG